MAELGAFHNHGLEVGPLLPHHIGVCFYKDAEKGVEGLGQLFGLQSDRGIVGGQRGPKAAAGMQEEYRQTAPLAEGQRGYCVFVSASYFLARLLLVWLGHQRLTLGINAATAFRGRHCLYERGNWPREHRREEAVL